MKRNLDQMLRAVEHTSPAQTYHVDLHAAHAPVHTRTAPYRRMAVLATALLAFSLLFTLVIISLQKDDGILPEPQPPQQLPDELIDVPYDQLPPWLNGKLSVTTLTYGSLAKTDLSLIGSPSLLPLSEEISPAKSQNVSISLQPGASVKGTESASVLRIRPTAGEHRSCAAVYFDIDDDEIFCLSCELYDAIVDEPLYRDAWLRAVLEEGVLHSRYAVVLDEYEPYYAALYQAMYDNQVQKQVCPGFPLSLEELGITHLLDQLPEHYVADRTKQSTYEPRIEIISYGIEKKQCLFSLLATRKDDKYK